MFFMAGNSPVRTATMLAFDFVALGLEKLLDGSVEVDFFWFLSCFAGVLSVLFSGKLDYFGFSGWDLCTQATERYNKFTL